MSNKKSNKGSRAKSEFTIINPRIVVTITTADGEIIQMEGPGGESFNELRAEMEACGATIVNVVPAGEPTEAELAEALDRYTDPNHPDYDPEFHAQVFALEPKGIRPIARV